MAHTPGPWKTVQGVDDDPARWVVVAAGSKPEWHIATVENGQPGDSLDTEAATARLIAAAPDLLAALKAINTHWEAGNFSRDPSLWEPMRAAIAKAEGRS